MVRTFTRRSLEHHSIGYIHILPKNLSIYSTFTFCPININSEQIDPGFLFRTKMFKLICLVGAYILLTVVFFRVNVIILS